MIRHRRRVFCSTLLAGALVAAAGAAGAVLGTFLAGTVICLLGAFYGEVCFRCPRCGSYMGVGRYRAGGRCRDCGTRLEQTEQPQPFRSQSGRI